MSNTNCPCGQGDYATCCEPLHLGKTQAQSAEQLMRSRYSAFVKHCIDYIVKTTAVGQQSQLDQAALAQWSTSNQWEKLEIISGNPRIDATHAMVEFKAYYFDGNAKQIHHEVSYFVKHQAAWYFIDPTVEAFPTMKQPCLCGSEKKFKHCCAAFIL